MTATIDHGYGVHALLNGHPVAWFAANWAHALDDDGEPIPGVEPQQICTEDRGSGIWGVVDPWPGVPARGVGISAERDGDVAVRFPLSSRADPGDTINIGPLVRA